MWIFTAGADPRCRVFVNAAHLSKVGPLRGREFVDAIQPEPAHGIDLDSFVLAGWPADGGPPLFLCQFPDDEGHHTLAAVQEAVRQALDRGAGVLDLEPLLASR